MNHAQRFASIALSAATALFFFACSTAQPPPASGPPAGEEATGQAGVVASATGGGVALGGACGATEGACGDDGYCLFPADAPCGDGGVAGVCTARPRGCKRDCPAVCGCEGEFYCNACVAHAQGRAVRHAGRCEGHPPEPDDAGETCRSETGKVVPCE